ncbi:MAG: ABC transporter transmembrane domain-containing protein, partial [Eubacteriales bacterium]
MFEIRFIWKNLKGKRLVFLIGLFLTAITSAIVIVNPYLTKFLVDDVIRGEKRDLLLPVLLVMCLVVLIKTGLYMLKVVCMEFASQHLLMTIRQRIFHNVQYQEMRYFDHIRAGDIITRATGDLEYLRHFVAYICYNMVDMAVIFLAAVIMLMFVSVPLTLCLLA